jgi:hypothetical protein
MIEDTSKHVCVYNHDVRICSEGAVLILEHPAGCYLDEEGDTCRDKILTYMIHEGYLDKVEESIVIDSYLK